MSTAALARARRQIRAACSDRLDARSLRIAVLDALRGAVGFDAFAWLLTDPETSVGSSPVADVPSLEELPTLIRHKYATPVNRWTAMPGPVATLAVETEGDLARSAVWDASMRAHGVTDVLSAVHRDRYGCWSFVDLWRSGGTFAADEIALLAQAAPDLTAALRGAQARTFARPVPSLTLMGPLVLVLDADLAVQAQTAETEHVMRTLVPPGVVALPPVPAGAYNVGAQLLANESGADSHPPLARVHLDGGAWLTVRAARLDGAGTGTGTQPIAVTIETASAADRLAVFSRAVGLSARESELLAHLVGGADTREVANLMFVSPHTVQDHLKSMFAKAETRSRRVLVAAVLGA